MTRDAPPTWRHRLRAALRPGLAFAGIAAAVFVVAVALSLYARGWVPFSRSGIALIALALPPALVAGLWAYVLDVLAPRAGPVVRGLSMAAVLTLLGPVASAALFGVVYRSAYPEEFAPILSRLGLHELIWTGISSTYLFLIAGPRLYLPFAPAAVLALGLLFALRGPALRGPAKSARDPSSNHQIEKSR